MKATVRICLCDDTGLRFFGEGPYRLLLGVERLGSLRAAAQEMNMAYTKASALMKHAEQVLGFPLTRRKIGGNGGGGSVLTPGAKELMERYERYCAACREQAERLYQECFSSFRPEEFAADGKPGRGENHPD